MTASKTFHDASSADERSLKSRVYIALEDPMSARPLGKAFGIGLIVLIVLNALLVGITDSDLSIQFGAVFLAFSILSTVAFAVEYCCRIWISDLVYPHVAPRRARIRYIFSPMGIIDFLAFFPAIIVLFLPGSAVVNDAARIIRLIRLVKISRYMRGLRSISRVFMKHRQEIIAAFMVLALLAIASSVLMYQAEHYAQPEAFDSILTGLYWAMTTMTSTGYGDIVPITPIGRLIGFMTMVISIGVVAIPAGIFSAGFIEEFRTQRYDESVLEETRSEEESSEEAHLKEAHPKEAHLEESHSEEAHIEEAHPEEGEEPHRKQL